MPLTGSLDDPDLPAGTTPADVVDALAGAFPAAFVRAAKPACKRYADRLNLHPTALR